MSLRRGAVTLAIALAPFVYSAHSSGQAPKAGPPAPEKPPPPPPPEARGLAALVEALAKALSGEGKGALVVASPLTSDVAAPKGGELSARLASLLAGRLEARAHGAPAPLSTARALSGRASSLLYLRLEIAAGSLKVTADLFPVVANSWDRLKNSAPGPRRHAFAASALDAEIRSFLAPAPLEQAALHKAPHREGAVLAIACGDLDEDGGLELALVSRTHVALGKLRGGAFVTTARRPWDELGKHAPQPLREPLAGAVLSPRDAPGLLLVGTTDRGGVALDAHLRVVRPLAGVPLAARGRSVCAAPAPAASSFEGALRGCDPGSATIAEPPYARFDAASTLDLVSPLGEVSTVIAARDPSGSLRVVRGPSRAPESRVRETGVEGAGAQVLVEDLDDDGEPEIVTTLDAPEDAITIHTWRGEALAVRRRLPAPAGVSALGACPAEASGRRGLVAAVGGEVWLVR